MASGVQFDRVNARTIRDSAYDILRQKVVSKEFAPGERLDLASIERQLGVSRTPLKEALARLEMEGLVHIAPRSGTFVTDPGAQEILESFEVRRALEVYAVGLAAQLASPTDLETLEGMVAELSALVETPDRQAIYPHYLELDHELHSHIVALAGNGRLKQAHDKENLHAQMARIRYRRSERELAVAQAEHLRILSALRSRDAGSAREEMDAHLKRAARSLLEDMNDGSTHPGAGEEPAET